MKQTSIFKGGLVLGLWLVALLCLPNLVLPYTEYVIGMTAPRSGTQTFMGDMQVSGAEVAIDEINAKGGVDGVPIRMIVEDHQAKPTMAITAFQKLVSVNKVPLVFTTYNAPQLAQAPLATKHKVVMINVGAPSTKLINCSPYMFHTFPNVNNLLRVATHYMCEELGLRGKRWALLYTQDPSGIDYYRYMKTLLPLYEMTEIFSDNWQHGATTDFRPLVSKTMTFKPDTVFLGGLARENAFCIKQMKEAGFTGPVLSIWGGDLLLKEAGGQIVLNTYYGEQIIPDNERVRKLKNYVLNVKKLPMFPVQSIDAYDTVYLVAEAIKYAKEHYGGDYFTGEKLRQAIREKREFTSLSIPGILDLDTHMLSRIMGVKTFKEQNGKVAEVTVKVYTAEEFRALPEGTTQ